MKYILKRLAIGIMAIVLLISSCKNPAEDVEIVVNTDIFKSPTLVLFNNANIDAEDPNEFPVEIIGPNADLVRTTTGGKVFKVAAGMLNIMLDRSATPSEANPVKFTVVVNAPGFAPTYKDISITSETTANIIRVPMVEYANPPEAVGISIDKKAIAAGTTTGELKFITPTHANMTQQATITVQPGTSFLDAAGQSVAGAELEARIVYQGKAPDGLMASLPGGNISNNVILANGQLLSTPTYLHSLGSVTIDMFAGGKEVKRFSKPLIIDLELGTNVIDQKTQLPLTEGQTVPIYSLNEETGQCKSEGIATLVKNANGSLVGRMQISHLSTWAIIDTSPGSEGMTCKNTVTIKRPQSDHDQKFQLYSEQNGNQITIISMLAGEASKTVEISQFPAIAQKSIVLAPLFSTSPSKYNYDVLKAAIPIGRCNNVANFDYTAKSKMVYIDLNVNVKCKGNTLQTGLNASIKMTGSDAKGTSTVLTLKNGAVSVTLLEGSTYTLVASIDGKSYKNDFTVKRENFQFPVIAGFSGSSIYDATTNTLNISVLVTKDCN